VPARDQEILTAADLNGLLEVARSVVHLSCWKAEIIHGDRVCLHWGPTHEIAPGLLPDPGFGTWYLCSEEALWSIETAGGQRVVEQIELERSTDRQAIESRVRRAIEGQFTRGFNVAFPSLETTLQFGNGFSLGLAPHRDGGSD
jgi:hypothetical protein